MIGMNTTTQALYNGALQLPESDRAELAAWLIESLDADVDDDIDAAWQVEIQQRIEQLDSGRVAGVPWPEARKMIMGLADGSSAH
jgi:putative addiction module component (TIGR02574 family)